MYTNAHTLFSKGVTASFTSPCKKSGSLPIMLLFLLTYVLIFLLQLIRKETMECNPSFLDGGETEDTFLEKVLALTESLDLGLGYIMKCKVDLPVNVSINNAAHRYLFSANLENSGQFRGFNVIGA